MKFTGMMWFDNDPKTTLTAKIVAAATYYREKYGLIPNLCWVNPKVLVEPEFTVGRVVVKPSRSVMPGHLWIGVEVSNGPTQSA
jgi:hypothetical protein